MLIVEIGYINYYQCTVLVKPSWLEHTQFDINLITQICAIWFNLKCLITAEERKINKNPKP